GPSGGAAAERRAAEEAACAMRAAGTVLVGDISNTASTSPVLVAAGLGGVVFHELIGFRADDPSGLVSAAVARAGEAEAGAAGAVPPVRVTVAAHAPYSVSPSLFREIAARAPMGP